MKLLPDLRHEHGVDLFAFKPAEYELKQVTLGYCSLKENGKPIEQEISRVAR